MNESNTNYYDLLYQKASKSQDDYRDYLLTLSSEEILNHAYEYTTREDIVLALMLNADLANGGLDLGYDAKSLYESPDPLTEIYDDFVKQDDDYYMRNIDSVIATRAEKENEKQKEEEEEI